MKKQKLNENLGFCLIYIYFFIKLIELVTITLHFQQGWILWLSRNKFNRYSSVLIIRCRTLRFQKILFNFGYDTVCVIGLKMWSLMSLLLSFSFTLSTLIPTLSNLGARSSSSAFKDYLRILICCAWNICFEFYKSYDIY